MSTKLRQIRPKPLLKLSFFSAYQEKILDEYKFSDSLRDIWAFYEPAREGAGSFLGLEDCSFCPEKNAQVTGKVSLVQGLLAHYATVDSYEKMANQEEIVNMVKDNISKYHFILFIYGDLKTFLFRYKFLMLHKNSVEYTILSITREYSEEQKKLLEKYKTENSKNVLVNFCALLDDKSNLLVNDLSVSSLCIPVLVRNALVAFRDQAQNVKSVILAKDLSLPLDGATVLDLGGVKVRASEESLRGDMEKAKGIQEIKMDLKEVFSQETVAENAVDLNINLMKWRMCPFLDTALIRSMSYLLIGAGTLGCHVARTLLGWGARKLTLLDYGRVSFSNPVRQSLYTFSDSCGGKFKAEAAAERLREVFPKVEARGFRASIPLPGRTLIDEKAIEGYIKNLEIIENEIKNCDILFLLTDSRESRWYPTVIAKAYDKKVITAAIGFDSYLVMRHGLKSDGLGCYFCTDITTPGDTSGSRTLDQQCTISRPGTSMICSGLAAELAMSVCCKALNEEKEVPHQIRGNISNFEMNRMKFMANKNCVACSDNIVKAYLERREEFLINVMNDPYYIEKTCGVHDIIKNMKEEDMGINEGDDF